MSQRPDECGRFSQASPRIEGLLEAYRTPLGRDADAYGNHVRRVYGLVRAQGPHLAAEDLEQVAIAAVFHDLAIWVDDTFDYLEPSRIHAADYLSAEGLASWIPVVSALILDHHKLRPVRGAPLVEAFRRADLADLSFGMISRGIPAGAYRELVAAFPVCGFQQRLARFAWRQARLDPLRPLPMLRW